VSKERAGLARKSEFRAALERFVRSLVRCMSGDDKQWTVKGFIDLYKNIYTISADTKMVSKILELHMFPEIAKFARECSYSIVLPDHQNYYPDLSFISNSDPAVKFAVDIKTSYRLPDNTEFCNGFTLGSHGSYFVKRSGRKNIQFPYDEYAGHFCIGIIYSRTETASLAEARVYPLDKLQSIGSAIADLQFFVCEKWEIATDSQGSGNTANIGSIVKIDDIIRCNGVFKNLGEAWFDDYWMNYGRIVIGTGKGRQKTITKLAEFLKYRGSDPSLANSWVRASRGRSTNA